MMGTMAPEAPPPAREQQGTAREEWIALVRALCGGFIFAVPIIYTMEVWWLGHTLPLWKVLTILAAGYVLAVGMNYFSGYREDASWGEVFEDAMITQAVGIVVAFVMLVVMGVVTTASSLRVVLGQVSMLAVPIAFGASVARSQFLRAEEDDGEPPPSGWKADLRDLGMTVLGGTFIGLSIAPTEEVLMIASQSNLARLIAVVALSLLLSYAVIFAADFSGQSQRRATEGALQSPLAETFFSYVVSLGVSFVLISFLGFISGADSLLEVIAMVVVLGLPVTLGGAAGRLLL